MLILFQFIAPYPLSFGNHKFVFICLWVCFCFINKFIYIIFWRFYIFVCVFVTQSCPTLCDPMDSPGFSAHGILQARILAWVAIPFSRGAAQPRKLTQVSHMAGDFFIIWTTREAQDTIYKLYHMIVDFLTSFNMMISIVVRLLRHVRLFETLWTGAHHAFLFFTISWNLFKLMSIESLIPYNHLILCHHLLLLPSRLSNFHFTSLHFLPLEYIICISEVADNFSQQSWI